MAKPFLFACLGLCLFALLALPAARLCLLPGDRALYTTIQAQRSSSLKPFFRTVTRAGDRDILTPVAAGMVLWQRQNPKLGLFLASYALAVPLLEILAKKAIARPRPPGSHSGYGFPSGHALASTALYGMLMVLLREKIPYRKWQQGIAGGLLLLTFLIGLSRLYLGVHWPSDVLGGHLLGGAYCFLGIALYRKIQIRSKAQNRGKSFFICGGA